MKMKCGGLYNFLNILSVVQNIKLFFSYMLFITNVSSTSVTAKL